MSLSIAFFGSSLVSAYWNGAATYYRGILQALAANGHRIAFYEPDAYDRQKHRDIPDPAWAQVVVYPATEAGVERALETARAADLLVKASGVGVFDRLLEERVPTVKRPGALAATTATAPPLSSCAAAWSAAVVGIRAGSTSGSAASQSGRRSRR